MTLNLNVNLVRPIIAASLFWVSLPALAQQPAPQPAPAASSAATPSPQRLSLAAGYKALTLCSALFTARAMGGARTLAHVEGNELVGIYPELDPLIGTLTATIGDSDVSVAWDAHMPPRFARYDAASGCTLHPVGLSGQNWLQAPQLPRRIPAPAYWPLGDLAPILVYDSGPIAVAGHGSVDAASARAREESWWASPTIDPAVRDGPVLAAFTATYGAGTNTTAVVVIRGGDIVAEHYAAGFGIDTPQRTWSVAKSIAATIIGTAVYRGDADVNAPAAIANWRGPHDPRGAITLDHLLHMASGLTSDSAGNRTDALYFGGTTVDEQAPAWPLVATPGSTFRYANNDTLLAILSISQTFRRHPPRELFDRLNMNATTAETDWRGNYILSSQVWTTARDLARFGMLYLNDGVWNGRRILPENWRSYVSTPSGPQPPGPFGYGASFWLMNHSDGVPADTFAAFGNRGQYVVIVPSRDVVIVRRGEDPSGSPFDIAAFTRDILAALPSGS